MSFGQVAERLGNLGERVAPEDFTRDGERYDLMLDGPGNRSWSECKRVLVRSPA